MAKKPQTEEKAKGLLKNVGNYKGKTLNLSKKQLGASGRAAAGARKIAISRTKYDPATKKVLGPMGKPITGRVDLGGGNIAVYKNGVRVRAQAPSSKPKGGGGGGGDTKKEKSAAEKAGAGRKYEERKAAVGGSARTRSTAGSIKARQAKFGGPGSSVQARQAKFGGMRVNEMDQPYRSGKTRPIPGKSEAARRYNESQRAYPSRRVAQEQEKALDNSLLIASILPVGGAAARGAMAIRGARTAKAVAARKTALKQAAARNTVVGAQARNAATRGLPSGSSRRAISSGRK